MSSQYIAVDLNRCLALNHHYEVMGSDKTPMKRNLLCLTCTIETGRTAIAAYGVDTLSWGQWRRAKQEEESDSTLFGLPAKTETP